MLVETGRVVAVEGNRVWVETLRQSACGSCSARAGCGHGVLNAVAPGASRAVVKARLAEGVRFVPSLHDEVRIALPEKGFLRGAFVLYALPILATLGGALLSNALVSADATPAQVDLTVTLGAVIGLGAGLLLLRLGQQSLAMRDDMQPIVTGRA